MALSVPRGRTSYFLYTFHSSFIKIQLLLTANSKLQFIPGIAARQATLGVEMAADLYLGSLPSLKEHLILDASLPELLRLLPSATTRIICSDPLFTINLLRFLEGVSSYSLYILFHVLETHVRRPLSLLSRQLRHDVDLPTSFLSVSLSLYSFFNYQIIHAWLFQQPNHPRSAFQQPN